MEQRTRNALRRLGKRLRDLRERRGLTQAEVAEKAGYTSKYVSEIERGRRDVPFSTLTRIVEDALGFRLFEAFASVTSEVGHAGTTSEGLPRAVEELARELGTLPSPRRARVLQAIRAMLDVAR